MKTLNLVSLKNFVEVKNLTPEEIFALIDRAEFFKCGGSSQKLANPVYVSNMFFEDSSRTHTSFEMAERKLGLTVIPFDAQHSSVNKGETLYDTSLIMDAVGVNLEVIRHSKNEYYQELIKPEGKLDLGVINAGDGSGQHPSQCMLDMMTIHENFGKFKDLKIAIVGDITNSRVAKSDMQLLKKLGAEIYFAGPKYWYDESFAKYGEYQNLDDMLPDLNVVMLLRVQHERHQEDEHESEFNSQEYHKKYGITLERYQLLKEKAIIMHPGPINHDVELAGELVEAPKSKFYQQMQNGVFMRMAMIEAVMRGRKLGGIR